jgi:hypothetical protein
VAGKPDRRGDDGNSSFRLSSYPLRSLPKSDLQLHSPLRTPKRLSRNTYPCLDIYRVVGDQDANLVSNVCFVSLTHSCHIKCI